MNHSAENEHPILFNCENETLVGILNKPISYSQYALLIIVGGPQYRVGSHRQFVELSRSISSYGIVSFRFDYRGMGDSDGKIRNFLEIEHDIKSAIDYIFEHCDGIKNIVLWGLCDAATAATYYCSKDIRVAGLVLLNPWVREDISNISSKTLIKHYYLKKLFTLNTWKNALFDKGNVKKVKELVDHLKNTVVLNSKTGNFASKLKPNHQTLSERMLKSLEDFSGDVLLVTSQKDLTAKEFLESVVTQSKWKKIVKRKNFTHISVEGADHTFTDRHWKHQVEEATKKFIMSI